MFVSSPVTAIPTRLAESTSPSRTCIREFRQDGGTEDDPEHPHNGDPRWNYHRKPTQAAAYAQTKLEFQGMIANLGLRLDYFHAGGEELTYCSSADWMPRNFFRRIESCVPIEDAVLRDRVQEILAAHWRDNTKGSRVVNDIVKKIMDDPGLFKLTKAPKAPARGPKPVPAIEKERTQQTQLSLTTVRDTSRQASNSSNSAQVKIS